MLSNFQPFFSGLGPASPSTIYIDGDAGPISDKWEYLD